MGGGLAHVVLGGREKRVRGGHPWVFATEVADIRGVYEPGDTVDVVTSRGGFIGRGYINPASQIIVRLLTRRSDESIDEEFYRSRVREAVLYRRDLFAVPPAAPAALTATPLPADIGRRAFRLIFAEADQLPAFVVDYFAGVLVFQALALGVDRVKDLLVRLAREEAAAAGFPVLGVYERDDAPVRTLEGLPLTSGPFWGQPPDRVTILENGVLMVVDVARGQKTGYFLDQRENRAALGPYVRAAAGAGAGARVLDCFCYSGSFALAAAAGGAAEVLGVDSSAEALALAAESAKLNGHDAASEAGGAAQPAGRAAVSFVEANVFDFLRQAEAEGRGWDVIILDPPAFAKNRAALPGALRGYKEINLRALKLLPSGGYLVTSSCSQHVSEDAFREMLASAAADTRRRVRVVEVRSQAKDHPTLPAAPETRYLKLFILRVE
jgi:23S rRNA (cytosine1962-C5)-methyltransferase